MNKCIFIGRLTKDPELRTTQSGVSVCTFTLAVDRRRKDKDGERKADFFTVVTWRSLADLCAKYLSKGKKCMVSGEMQNRSYEDKDGQKRYITELKADEIEFLSPAEKSAPAPDQQTEPTPTPPPVPAQNDDPFGLTEAEFDWPV